jgi:hypothetical protein
MHLLIGGMILPLVLFGTAIWFTIMWKPDIWPGRPAQVIKVLVDIQFLLGLSFWIYLIIAGGGGHYLAFPFLLHPFLGLTAAMVVQQGVRRQGVAARLGRWGPLATLGLLLLIVLIAGRAARAG